VYARVLAPGQSQVTAMEALDPKVVSVELGANEILGARDGAYVPGQTVVPVAAWQPRYEEVVARVAATARRGVLVGLIDDVRNFPAFRTGAELWAARATFAPFHVQVSENCGTAPGAANLLFVPVRVPLAAGEGAQRRQQNLRRRCSAAQRAGRGPERRGRPRLRARAGRGRAGERAARGDERGHPGPGRAPRVRILRAVGAVRARRVQAAVQRRRDAVLADALRPAGEPRRHPPQRRRARGARRGRGARAERDVRYGIPTVPEAAAPLAAALAGR
jgi:hypothetical protein